MPSEATKGYHHLSIVSKTLTRALDGTYQVSPLRERSVCVYMCTSEGSMLTGPFKGLADAGTEHDIRATRRKEKKSVRRENNHGAKALYFANSNQLQKYRSRIGPRPTSWRL